MKKKKEEKDNSERWLITYSDLITLLMVLFVILYASSNVDGSKYKQLASSLRQALNINNDGGGSETILDGDGDIAERDEQKSNDDGDKTTIATDTAKAQELTEEQKLDEIQKKINKLLKDAGLSEKVMTRIEDRGLVVSISDKIFFDSGKADVKENFKQDLIAIARVLNEDNNYIRIEGHTDNVKINNDQFSSNWQLSSIRAANVVQVLIDRPNNEATDNIRPMEYLANGIGASLICDN